MDDQLKVQIAQRWQDYRMTYVDRKKTRQGDRLVGQWLLLKLSAAQNSSERASLRVAKELNTFFSDPRLQEAEALSPVLYEEVLYENLFDAARQYQQSCVDDPQYNSVFFALKKLTPEQVAVKAAKDVYTLIIPFLLKMPDTRWRDLMLIAIDHAYQAVFADLAVDGIAVLADRVEESLVDEFKRIGKDKPSN